jgi:hypothetical protein
MAKTVIKRKNKKVKETPTTEGTYRKIIVRKQTKNHDPLGQASSSSANLYPRWN